MESRVKGEEFGVYPGRTCIVPPRVESTDRRGWVEWYFPRRRSAHFGILLVLDFGFRA